MAQLNAMMDHQDLPKPLRLRLRSFFLQNRYQAFYLTQQDLLKDSPFFGDDDITDVVVGGCAKIAVRCCEAFKFGTP